MRDLVINTEFRCLHCRQLVSTHPALAGVYNRNHCPYCLWSRCLDLYRPGDRLSACKAEMRPVGLTLKQVAKRYPAASGSELMLIHQCLECDKLSINRIAADDFADRLIEVYVSSRKMAPFLRRQLTGQGILLLRAADYPIVHTRLFGKN